MPVDGASHDVQQLRGRGGLDQITKRTVFDGANRALQVGAPGQEDERDVQVLGPDCAEQRQSVHVGHVEIADDRVEASGVPLGDGLSAAAHHRDTVSLPQQEAFGRSRNGGLVVHHQDGWLRNCALNDAQIRLGRAAHPIIVANTFAYYKTAVPSSRRDTINDTRPRRHRATMGFDICPWAPLPRACLFQLLGCS